MMIWFLNELIFVTSHLSQVIFSPCSWIKSFPPVCSLLNPFCANARLAGAASGIHVLVSVDV